MLALSRIKAFVSCLACGNHERSPTVSAFVSADEPAGEGVSREFLSHLAAAYDVIAACKPRLDVVPLHPSAGWIAGAYVRCRCR